MRTPDVNPAGSRFPREPFGFTVHSVFPRALNLRPDNGAPLLSLVSEAKLAHPRAALTAGVAFDTLGLQPGARGRFDGQRVTLEAGPSIDVGGRASAQDEAVRASASPLHRRCRLWQASALVESLIQEKGGPLLPGFDDRLADAAATVQCAVTQRGVGPSLEAWSGLLGLGPGLTPAADDFLCGYWAGLWAQAAQDPGLGDFLEDFARSFATSGLLAATNDISAAFVAEAVEGRFGAALVAFAEAALGVTEGLDEAAAALASVGASSGLDAARGFLFAFQQERGP